MGTWTPPLLPLWLALMEVVLPHPCVTVGVVLGAERSSIQDLTREELSLHALLVTGEQLLMEILIKRSLKVAANFFVGRSVYKSVRLRDILM